MNHHHPLYRILHLARVVLMFVSIGLCLGLGLYLWVFGMGARYVVMPIGVAVVWWLAPKAFGIFGKAWQDKTWLSKKSSVINRWLNCTLSHFL